MDSSPLGQLRMWIHRYLSSATIYPSWAEGRKSDMPTSPHIELGFIYMNLTAMCEWAMTQRISLPEPRAIATRLRELGATPKTKAIKGKTSFSFWQLPADDFPPADVKVARAEEVFGGREQYEPRVN